MQSQEAVRFKVPKDVWIGLILLAVTAFYWRTANTIPISPLDGVVNAAAVPKALAMVMAAFCVILIARALAIEWMFVRAARAAAGATAPQRLAGGERDATLRDHLRAAGILVIGAGYLLILPYLGYLPSMILLVATVAVFIGSRASLYTLGVATATSVVFYLLFVQLLDIPLPPGIWPSLLP